MFQPRIPILLTGINLQLHRKGGDHYRHQRSTHSLAQNARVLAWSYGLWALNRCIDMYIIYERISLLRGRGQYTECPDMLRRTVFVDRYVFIWQRTNIFVCMWYGYDSGWFESAGGPLFLLRVWEDDWGCSEWTTTVGLWKSGLGVKRREILKKRATENRCNVEPEGELSVYYRASWASLWVSHISYNFPSAILVMVPAFTETPFPRIWWGVTDGDFGVSHTVRLCPRLINQRYLDYRSWVLGLYRRYSCMVEISVYHLECLGALV